MFRKLLILMMTLCVLAQPGVAINARTYDDAMNKGKKRPVVLFCYGANYDRYNLRVYDEFIKQRKLMPFVRNCVFLEVPIYQMPDDKEKKEFEKVMGKGRGIPGGVRSLPCLVLMDGSGSVRGSVYSADEMKTAEDAGKALEVLLERFEEQEKLVNKAAKAGAGRQAKLLAQALDVNLDMPLGRFMSGGSLNLSKDKIGLSQRFQLDPLKLVQQVSKMSQPQANAFIRRMIDDGCYSRRQRQELLACLAGHARRNNASANRLRALYYEMRNIDPTSIYGRYAEGAIEVWVKPLEKKEKEGQ